MLKGANKRTLKVVSHARTGVATSLNKDGPEMVDFSAFFKHLHKPKFIHPKHWLPGAAPAGVVAKPSSSILRPAVTLGLSSHSVRYAHNDMSTPDFSAYRTTSTKDVSSQDRGEGRKTAQAAVSGSFFMGLAIIGKSIVHPVIQQWSAAADVLALAQIEIKKSEVAPGTNKTFKWRGKPLFVRRRTEQEIEAAKNVDMSSLKDPESDDTRVKDPEWLVVLGVCTHLGCVPIPHQGAFGGYYCPCHGSHYDTSGRIRQGPAPLNLEVPEHSFEDDKLLVG